MTLLSLVHISAADDASGNVQLAWDANPEPDIAGYRVLYGTASGEFSSSVEIKTTPEATLAGLEFGTTYYCVVQAINTAGLNSANSTEISFALPSTGQPEIAVQQASGSALIDLTSATNLIDLGSVDVGAAGITATIFLKNLGSANLTGLAVNSDDPDFTVTPLASSTLAPGEKTLINVTFTPAAAGTRTTTLHIVSNDADENVFDVSLTGRGIATSQDGIGRPGSGLAVSAPAIHFSDLLPGQASAPETFTLTNTGSGDLTGIVVATGGAAFGDFILGAPGASSLAAGESTTFQIVFKPTAPGFRSANVQVLSDGAEIPLVIDVDGHGIARPDIAVQNSHGTRLVDGVAAVQFANLPLEADPATEFFTLRNLGNADLTGLAFAITGDHASDFSATAPPVTSLAPGQSTTFGVAFDPTAAGTRAATLHIASNDPDEASFDIGLAGNAVGAPAISVSGPDAIEIGDASSQDFGVIQLATTGDPRTFTLHNSGTTSLTGLAISAGGPAAADFLVDSLGETILAPGSSKTFRISFRPSVAGTRTATFHIACDDASVDVFDIALSGSGVAMPNLALENADGTPMEALGAVISFDNVNVGASGSPVTCVVRNSGTAVLTGLQVILAGAQASSFVLGLPPMTSLEPGATTSFTVRFKPVAGGLQTAVIRIADKPALQAPFEITVSGGGVPVPEIAIRQDNGTNLTSGSASVSFGNCNLGSVSPVQTFTIKNQGTAPLTGLSVASDNSEFVTGSLGSTTLAPGASTTFRATFEPAAAGTRGARLSVGSNDADENPFLITLTGKGVEIPEIVVQSGTKDLKDGNAFINFGTLELDSTSKARVFTIHNSGTAALTHLAILRNGINAADFKVSALRTTTLAPGTSTSFKVTFSPGGTGIRWGAIHISSNDANEHYFDIVLTGNGTKEAAPSGLQSIAKLRRAGAMPAAAVAGAKGIEVIDGRKYRTLTLTKAAGNSPLPRNVEVSSNLVDWSSGNAHTTILINNTTTLKVRDNTPISQGDRRYIRLKP